MDQAKLLEISINELGQGRPGWGALKGQSKEYKDGGSLIMLICKED